MRTIRTSERTTFASCVQKWYWAYVDFLKPRQVALPLSFGTLVHTALAEYYPPGLVRGAPPVETFIREYDALGVDLGGSYDDDGERINSRDLGIAMLTGYVKHWGADNHFEIIQPEMQFRVIIYDANDDPIAEYLGTMDAVMRLVKTKQLGLLEHKTAKSISFNHLFLDEQVSSYWALAPYFLDEIGMLQPGENLSIVYYNVLRKGLPDPRPRNAEGLYLNQPTKANPEGAVSKRQPKPLFERRIVTRGEAEVQNLIERTVVQVMHMDYYEQNPHMVYKNPSRDCSWCPFRDMCELHETGNDWEAYRDATMIKWDPFAEHNGGTPDSSLTIAGTRRGGWQIVSEDD